MKAEWSRDLQEPHQEQGREESQQQGNSISQVPDINQARSGRNNRRKNSTSQEKKPGFWNGDVILELRVWILCSLEVMSKDELLQDVYLEEYSPLENTDIRSNQ